MLGMYLAGFAMELQEGRSLGWNTYPEGRLSPWAVVDALCCGEDERAKALAAAPPKPGVPRARHIGMDALFEPGKIFSGEAETRKVVEDVTAIWESTLNDANMRIATNRHVSDKTLIAAMKNAGRVIGVEPKVHAYFAGVPVEDLTVADGKMRGYH